MLRQRDNGILAVLQFRRYVTARDPPNASVEKSFKSASTAIDAKRPFLTLISTGRLRQQTGEINAETKSYSRDNAFTGADSILGAPLFKTEKNRWHREQRMLSPAPVTPERLHRLRCSLPTRQQHIKRLRRALRQEINPRGPIEKMYLADIAYLEWEIKRLRRGKIAMLNTAFRKGAGKTPNGTYARSSPGKLGKSTTRRAPSHSIGSPVPRRRSA